MDFMHDTKLLSDMGVLHAGQRNWAPDLTEDTATRVLSAAMDLWCSWVSFEYRWVSLYSCNLPGLAMSQLSEREVDRQTGMANLESLWAKLIACEEAAWSNSFLHHFLRDLQWPRSQWSREILVSACECGFNFLPDDILAQVREAATSIGSSKIAEDSFNICRAQTEGVRNGTQSARAAWHAVVASPLLENHEMAPIKPSTKDQVESAAALPTSVFSAAAHEAEFTLGAKQKDEFFDGQDYPMLSATRFLSVGIGARLLLTSPSAALLPQAFLSLLAIPGTVLWNTLDPDMAGIVLHSTEFGALVWRGRSFGIGSYRFFRLDSDKVSRGQFVVFDPDEWSAFDLCPRLPSWVRRHHDIPVAQLEQLNGVTLQIVPREESIGLLKVSALKDLPFFTLANLNRLWDEIGCKAEGRRPTLLLEVLRTVVEHICGQLSDEEWQCVLQSRTELLGTATWKSPLDNNHELVAEMAGPDADAIKKDSSKRKASRPAEAAKGAPPVAGSAGGAASSSIGPTPPAAQEEAIANRSKLVAPRNPRHWRQDDAVRLLPRVKGCTISPVGNRQWQVKDLSRVLRPRSHTQTYTEPEGEFKAHSLALGRCLLWAWNVHHQEMQGEECPHDLCALLCLPAGSL